MPLDDAPARCVVRQILGGAGVAGDATLIVHAGFRKLGAHGIAADAFIEACLDWLPDGTLLMPAMSWRICTPQNPVFDELGTRSIVGVLSERFRVGYATHRSIHPTHSVCGAGREAAELLCGHEAEPTPCARNSPFGRLVDVDGWVLLLEIGLERCTLMHHFEETAAPDVYLEPDDGVDYRCTDRDGRLHLVRARRHRRVERNFPRFEPALAAAGALHAGMVYDTPWRLFRAHALQDVAMRALAADPLATLRPGPWAGRA